MPARSAKMGLVATLSILVWLAACVAPEGSASGGGNNRWAVVGGKVMVVVPGGFCIDRQHSSDTADGAIVLAGKCSGDGGQAPVLLTISVGAPGSSGVLQAGARAMTDWFRSREGRAALARNGNFNAVEVAEAVVAEGVFYLRLRDSGIGEYWRAITGVNGHLVSISAAGPPGNPLDEETGRNVLRRVLAGLRGAN